MSNIWEKLEIEEIIQAALILDLDQSHGDERFGCYTTVRKNLLENLLEEIKKIQPDMTDHGPGHVRNVLENIQDLLGDSVGQWDRAAKRLEKGFWNGMELYILGLSALFHDVGNIFKREEHQKQIGPIYDYARPTVGGHQDSEEKSIVLDICKAHCGEGLDGSKNTLGFVTDRSKLARQIIRPNLLAPILRFADELAEGEQRTSSYLIRRHNYAEGSLKFHQYALSSNVDIDRAIGRIRLKYHITLKLPQESGKERFQIHGPLISTDELAEFLMTVYHRIEKVNQERQYAKFYCPALEPFKETSATFNFWYRGRELPIDLQPVIFSDLVVPGDPQRTVVERDNLYSPDKLKIRLTEAMNRIASQEE